MRKSVRPELSILLGSEANQDHPMVPRGRNYSSNFHFLKSMNHSLHQIQRPSGNLGNIQAFTASLFNLYLLPVKIYVMPVKQGVFQKWRGVKRGHHRVAQFCPLEQCLTAILIQKKSASSLQSLSHQHLEQTHVLRSSTQGRSRWTGNYIAEEIVKSWWY
jgi:hypothetical protein